MHHQTRDRAGPHCTATRVDLRVYAWRPQEWYGMPSNYLVTTGVRRYILSIKQQRFVGRRLRKTRTCEREPSCRHLKWDKLETKLVISHFSCSNGSPLLTEFHILNLQGSPVSLGEKSLSLALQAFVGECSSLFELLRSSSPISLDSCTQPASRMAEEMRLTGKIAPSSLSVSGGLGIKSTQDSRSAEGFSVKSTMKNTQVLRKHT